MKNFYVTLMAALLAGTSLAQAQSIQLQRMPSTQQQTVTATRSLLPSEASTLPMTSKVAPVADTLAASIPELAIPVGYASFTPASENISAVGSGAPISNLYGSAIELNSPQLTGTNIFAIRFFLYSAVGCESLEVFITEDLAGTSLVSQQVENPVSGWNYVVLDEPLSLEGRSKLFIGYYYQGSASYALSFEKSQTGVDTNADWYAQLTPEGQLAWSHMSTDGLGAVKNLVFAMMDTETPSMDYPTGDVYLESAGVGYYNNVRTGEEFPATVTVTNNGATTIQSLTLGYGIGSVTTQQTFHDLNLPMGASTTLTVNATSETEGVQEFYLQVSDLNDGTLRDEEESNNAGYLSFACYNEFFNRKPLIELFTSQLCQYCPQGYEYAEQAAEFFRDDVIFLKHHAGFADDIFTVSPSQTYSTFFGVDAIGNPAAMLDRITVRYQDGSQAVAFHPGNLSGLLPSIIGVPATSSVNIEGSIDMETRTVTITVSGDIISLGSDYDMANPCLNVMIVQDNYRAPQLFYANEETEAYWDTHDDFLRIQLSENFGDPITLDNGHYLKTYTYTIPESISGPVNPFEGNEGTSEVVPCVLDNMSIIAFTGNYNGADSQDNMVDNAEELSFSELEGFVNGIENSVEETPSVDIYVENNRVVVNGDYDTMAVFSINGQQVANDNLQEGFYIVRVTADNRTTVKKVAVF